MKLFCLMFLFPLSLHLYVTASTKTNENLFQKRGDENIGRSQNINLNEAGTSYTNQNDHDNFHVHGISHFNQGLGPAGREYRMYDGYMRKLNNRLQGVLHVGIKGDPNAEHSAPRTMVIDGKKGGRIVETFLKEPSPPRQSSSITPYFSKEPSNGSTCLIIGECRTLSSTLRERGPDHSHTRYMHTTVEAPSVIERMNENIVHAEKNGFKYFKTSTHITPDLPRALRDVPSVLIRPGKKGGQYFSSYYRPLSPPPPPTTRNQSSPERNRSPARQYSPPHPSPPRSSPPLRITPPPSPSSPRGDKGHKRRRED